MVDANEPWGAPKGLKDEGRVIRIKWHFTIMENRDSYYWRSFNEEWK